MSSLGQKPSLGVVVWTGVVALSPTSYGGSPFGGDWPIPVSTNAARLPTEEEAARWV
jgi:hypothetical protein